jgi:hypothetical protein
MTGHEYANLIADYVYEHFSDRGIVVYREVNLGKSIIGKNRRVDLMLVNQADETAFAIECKYQDSSGTADEKIPYALANMKALPMSGCIVYAGIGFPWACCICCRRQKLPPVVCRMCRIYDRTRTRRNWIIYWRCIFIGGMCWWRGRSPGCGRPVNNR